MNITKVPKTLKSTRFSEFIRNAPSSEKEKVYADVLRKASEEQVSVIRKAEKDKLAASRQSPVVA